ncbi:hypothetical protein CAOG_001640 [Capsaspora owczarzaki ATCC 30864]|uniref:Uncharacterized protein n=1 Tax=Capsaspora owczarzaki (strain ATCC 30864) TaxID=595528 RepID=A0A0D2X173_CAPO3|nr:hypothetical protein CAOG_001640 [Capsaspora owczarzaki ATCC 30864]
MLRHLLIISPAGTVLYDREFVKLIAQPRLTGSLITAILKVCSDVTGLPASYVEIGAVAVSIRTDAGRTGIICALFHDVQDGKQLGQLVATELLRLFLDRFRQHVSPPPVNLGIFQSFHSKILEGIRSSVRLVVDELQRCVPSIELCFLASNGRISHSTVDIDGVGVMANLSALREYAEELSTMIVWRLSFVETPPPTNMYKPLRLCSCYCCAHSGCARGHVQPDCIGASGESSGHSCNRADAAGGRHAPDSTASGSPGANYSCSFINSTSIRAVTAHARLDPHHFEFIAGRSFVFRCFCCLVVILLLFLH